jgi:hypothetical protein
VSYVVIRVYSFECDSPGSHSALQPGEIEAVTSTLRDAHKETRGNGWAVRKARGSEPAAHLCPVA